MLSLRFRGRRCSQLLALTSVVFYFVGHVPCLTAQSRADASSELRVLWQTVIAEDTLEVEYKGFAISNSDSSVWLVLGKRPALSMSGPQMLALRALDGSGKTLAEYSMALLTKTAGIPRVPDRFMAIAATEEGNIALLCDSDSGLFMFIMDGRTHGLDHAKGLEVGSNLRITRMLPTKGGGLLLLGNQGGRAVVIRLDRNLKPIWEKLAPEGVSVYLDGVALSDESVVLVGTYSPSQEKTAEIWIGRLNAGGEITKSVSKPGVFVSVAGAPEGGCAVVQGIVTAQGVDFWFRSFDRDLNESWNTKLLLGAKDYQEFRLSPVPHTLTDYLVVGSEKRVLWLARVRVGSSVLWTRTLGSQSGSFQDLLWNFGIASSAQAIVIPSTELVVDPKMQQRQVTKVVAFEIQ